MQPNAAQLIVPGPRRRLHDLGGDAAAARARRPDQENPLGVGKVERSELHPRRQHAGEGLVDAAAFES